MWGAFRKSVWLTPICKTPVVTRGLHLDILACLLPFVCDGVLSAAYSRRVCGSLKRDSSLTPDLKSMNVGTFSSSVRTVPVVFCLRVGDSVQSWSQYKLRNSIRNYQVSFPALPFVSSTSYFRLTPSSFHPASKLNFHNNSSSRFGLDGKVAEAKKAILTNLFMSFSFLFRASLSTARLLVWLVPNVWQF